MFHAQLDPAHGIRLSGKCDAAVAGACRPQEAKLHLLPVTELQPFILSGIVAIMSARWPAHRVLQVASGLVTAFAFCGLWICKLLREHQGVTERQFMETTLGCIAVWSLSGMFLVGLFILFPISLSLQRRAGIPLPGPVLPRWIAWPAKAVAGLAVGVFVLLILGLMVYLIIG